jgi:hypothetical protein
MKKIFIMFAIGWQFASGAMDLENSYDETVSRQFAYGAMDLENSYAGIVIGSLIYSRSSHDPAGEVSCYSCVRYDERVHYREFTPIVLPRSSVVINGVRFLVTSMENPIVNEMSPTPPVDSDDDGIMLNLETDNDTLRFICIPAGISSVSGFCFLGCSSLAGVVFEYDSKLDRIGKNTFASCLSLQSINIPKGVQIFGKSCFAFCQRLSSVTFEQGALLERIENLAFQDCNSLRLIILPNGMNVTPTQDYPWGGLTWDFGPYQYQDVFSQSLEDFNDIYRNLFGETREVLS